MTHNDYIAMAAALRKAFPGADADNSKLYAWKECCKTIADCCARDNPRFNTHRFLRACCVEV